MFLSANKVALYEFFTLKERNGTNLIYECKLCLEKGAKLHLD